MTSVYANHICQIIKMKFYPRIEAHTLPVEISFVDLALARFASLEWNGSINFQDKRMHVLCDCNTLFRCEERLLENHVHSQAKLTTVVRHLLQD